MYLKILALNLIFNRVECDSFNYFRYGKANSIYSLVAEPNKNGVLNSGITDDERKKIMETPVINDNNIVTPLIETEQGEKLKDDAIQLDKSKQRQKSDVPAVVENCKIKRRSVIIDQSANMDSFSKNELFEDIFNYKNRSFMTPPFPTAHDNKNTYAKLISGGQDRSRKINSRLMDYSPYEHKPQKSSNLSDIKINEHREDVYKSRAINPQSAPSNAEIKLIETNCKN
jgi:hypothetical protein